MKYATGTVGYFDMLYVTSDYRRMGVASKIIHAVSDHFDYEYVVEVNLR